MTALLLLAVFGFRELSPNAPVVDGVSWVLPMSGGRIIKLQATSQRMGEVPDMRLILDWGLSRLGAEKQ